MRTRLLTTLAGAAAATALVSAPAAAEPPLVVQDEDIDQVITLPASDSPCGIELTVHDVFSVRVTVFFDEDGDFARAQTHVHGTARVSSEHGEWVDRWAYTDQFDPESATVTRNGNVYNVHAGSGGVRLNDSGRLVIDDTTGEAIVINGPHEGWPYWDWSGDWDDACAAVLP